MICIVLFIAMIYCGIRTSQKKQNEEEKISLGFWKVSTNYANRNYSFRHFTETVIVLRRLEWTLRECRD